jgi:cation diffusion facilitator family transporter
MVVESIDRFINPVEIDFNKALVVAVLGIIVNGASVFILDDSSNHHHDHHHKHDHNLRAAYLHVLADALTSVFAIVALLCGKYLGANWMDPAMGFVGAFLITRWSLGLLMQNSQILLDKQLPEEHLLALRDAIEVDENDKVTDLHLWQIGPGIHAAEITLTSTEPRPANDYRNRLPVSLNIVHCTFEIHRQE